MWRKLRKILIWIVGIFISLVLILAFIVWLMQDKIKNYAIDYLNQHLKTELKVDEIDVTFLSTFPNASLKFRNVCILDPDSLQDYRDTLFSARTVLIKFGIWDIFSGDYKAKRIDCYNSYLRTFINKNGVENYDIVKSQPKDTAQKENFKLDLKSVNLYNTRLTYQNDATEQRYKFFTEKLSLKGNFNGSQNNINANGDLFVKEIRNQKLVILKNQDSEINFNLDINNQTKTLQFTNCEWSPGKMKLGIKGKIIRNNDETECNVEIFGKNISIVSVIQLLPQKMKTKINQYKSFGNLNLLATIKGSAGKTKSPDINAKFDINDGILIEKSSNISLHNIDLDGNFTNKNKLGIDELEIKNLTARLKDGEITIAGKLTDFNKPHFILKAKGKAGLATLHDFINPESVKEMKGEITLDSKLDFVLLRTDDLVLTNTIINEATGKIIFTDASIIINENGKPINELNGQLNLNNDDALVDGLTGKIGESDFNINGAIKGFTAYFITGKNDLSIVGAFNSENINLVDLIGENSATDNEKQLTENEIVVNEYQYNFPDNINLNFDLNIGKIKWQTFQATNMSGNFKLLEKNLMANNLTVDMAGGKCFGNINIDGKNHDVFLVEGITRIENVQLNKLLVLFKNFGQKLITPDNTKGIFNANVNWGMPVKSNLKIQEDKILAQADINISKGELKNIEQLKQLAEFMRTDKKMKLFLKNDAEDFESKVRNLKFDDLKNELTIKNGLLSIPKMEISSSALKLKFLGTHSFENKIDYHFNFRYIELKSQKNNTEFGEIADDGTGLKVYIHMFGDLDNPQYAWDKEERKIERQEQWNQEKTNFKSLLKEEFGLFKKDSTVKIMEDKKENVKFIMEWDEKENDKAKIEEQKKKDNERLKKLKKKMGIDENTNKDVKFEIEQ